MVKNSAVTPPKCIGQFLIPKGKQKEEKFDAYYCCS